MKRLTTNIRVTHSISRRSFIKEAALVSLAAEAGLAGAKTIPEEQLLFVGTQTGPASKGIYAYAWDATSGSLHELGLAAESDNPTFLALSPDNKRLYAANEINEYQGAKSGAISGFTVDRAAAKLIPLNTVPSTASGPCHVAVDATGHTVLCANYSGGGAASFHADAQGHLSEAVSEFHYHGHSVVADRQEAPHAHRATVSPDNRFVYINDLGLDCIHIYRLDAATSKLMPNPSVLQWTAKPGSGPRALRFHPNGKWAFCIHELACALEVLKWDPHSGALTSIHRVDLLPKDYHQPSLASEVVFDRQGKFAYAAVRGYDHIMTWAIDPVSATLTLLDRTSAGGRTPRHIAMDPTDSWLLVANQDSDNIAVIRRDKQTGKLQKAGESYPQVKPQCLVFI